MMEITADNHRPQMNAADFEFQHMRDEHYHEVSPHSHDFFELYFFVSGHVNYAVNKQILRLRPGDVIFIPPGVMHNPLFEDFDAPYERHVFWVHPKIVHELAKIDNELTYFMHQPEPARYVFRDAPGTEQAHLLQRYLQIVHLYRERMPLWRGFVQNFLSLALLYLNRSLITADASTSFEPVNALPQQLLSFIHGHLTEDLSLERLEKHFFKNRFYLSKLFKSNFHISLYQYIIR